jgi:hypothetical protein
MSQDEIQAALLDAFQRCQALGSPLSDNQKQILLQSLGQSWENTNDNGLDNENPLDKLTSEELTAFLEFVQIKSVNNLSWKVQLLNDWLHGNDSGKVQFIRDRYGIHWLNSLEAHHLEKYRTDTLKIGDQIEVCNALWEWVQDSGPCQKEWFRCMVISLEEIKNGDEGDEILTNCLVSFPNGVEYEIPGIYLWNKVYWRKKPN